MLVNISLCHAKIEKISETIFVMINKDGGGTIFGFYGGDIELMGVPPVPPLGKTLWIELTLRTKISGC